jgi:3'5'-cyclic nucleotide phosphodiesterase/Adenylate and Guanylate cyclase catalytic domain
MESTGLRDRIHISQETADLLVVSGKSHWVVSREDKVVAKGKGELTTYWLVPKDETAQSVLGGSDTVDGDQYERLAPGMGGEQLAQTLPNSAKNQKIQRMIDWNCDILMQLLRLVVAKREALGEESMRLVGDSNLDNLESDIGHVGSAVTEIHEMIELPGYDSAAYQIDPESVIINDDVAAQLHSYVTVIASMYRDNPFHNFEHASHVSMSTVKLMSRIVAPGQKLKMDDGDFASEELHDHTYGKWWMLHSLNASFFLERISHLFQFPGITSDPLTQFSVVLSALIHDVDHRGVPNFVLAQEDSRLATVYHNKSVAEQNSIDVAWEVLMDDEFRELRRTIYTSCNELHRFRQLVVNSVMATDIFDKELSALRKARWERAFGMDESFSPAGTNRKATIVIEHLIQASDVAHTMQHWVRDNLWYLRH